jgi:ABC-2 type transport system ATP-binding protein
MPAVLQARDLRKRFGNLTAVDGVSFQVEEGQMVGLLGPNGAGKTTTVSMITGLVQPDSGEVLIAGAALKSDADPIKRNIGVVPQELALFDEMTALENLELFGSLYGLEKSALAAGIGRAVDLVQLSDRRKDRVGTFSGGMKRRLNLAAALLHNPRILLLDEPTVGVDPQSRNAIFDNLEELKRQGKAIVYTTHYMEEVERMCDRVVIIDHGKVIAEDSCEGLYRMLPGANVLQLQLESAVVPEGLRSVEGVEWCEQEDMTLRAGLSDLNASAAVLAWLAAHGCRFHHLTCERADLEAVFLSLTGRSLRDA